MKKMRKGMREGFTLVELLIVIAILGALSASMSLAAKDATPQAQVAKLKSDFSVLRTAISMYMIDSSDKLPNTATAVTYFNNHSQDYLAGKIRAFTVGEEKISNKLTGHWIATYNGEFSYAAQQLFTDSQDYGITSKVNNKKLLEISMRVY